MMPQKDVLSFLLHAELQFQQAKQLRLLFNSMNKILFLMLFIPSISSASARLPEAGAFSWGGVVIGSTTIDEIQSKYGIAPRIRVGANDESPVEICYRNSTSKGGEIVFGSGPMGGFERITNFRVTKNSSKKNCALTSIDFLSLNTGNGVKLFQSKKHFMAAFGISFRDLGWVLLYKGSSKRKASPEEESVLRENYPTEPEYYFDVNSKIEAKFNNGILVDYYVSKLESY